MTSLGDSVPPLRARAGVLPTSRVRRRGSVYLAVAGTAMLISLIGLTAIHLSRIELRTITAQQEHDYARQLAQSSVEYAIGFMGHHNWRNGITHGTEYSVTPEDFSESLVYRFLDNTDNLIDNGDNDPVEVQGIGRYGSATFVYSVRYEKSVNANDQQGPVIAREMNMSGGYDNTISVDDMSWLAQYFVPNLPADAVTWTLTEVDLNLRGSGLDEMLLVSITTADGGLQPGSTIESVMFDEIQLSDIAFGWHTVVFSSVTERSPTEGLCLTLVPVSGGDPARVRFRWGGTPVPNAHVISGGSGSWTANHTDRSLYYRVRGVYTTSSGATGDFMVSPGSWQRIGAP